MLRCINITFNFCNRGIADATQQNTSYDEKLGKTIEVNYALVI